MRKSRTFRQTLAICSVLIAVGICSSALACSCVKASLEKRFNKNDVIFTGIVESSEAAPESYQKIWSLKSGEEFVYSLLQVKFKVKDVWKGELDKHTLLYTSNPAEDSCSYGFKEKGRYVVFARNLRRTTDSGDGEESDDFLWTGLCYWNINLGNVKEKRAFVRKLRRLRSELEESGEVDESQAEDIHRTPQPTEVMKGLEPISQLFFDSYESKRWNSFRQSHFQTVSRYMVTWRVTRPKTVFVLTS